MRDRGELASAVAQRDFTIEIVRELSGREELCVLPRHRVLERTPDGTTRWHRSVRDHERRLGVPEAMVRVATGAHLVGRTAPP